MNLIDRIAKNITMAELKAIIHLFIVPFALVVLSKNIFAAFVWLFFMWVLYSATEKKDSENAIVFLEMLKITVSILILVAMIFLFAIIVL